MLHSILQYNIRYLITIIYIAILDHHTTLAYYAYNGGARGVMVSVAGYGHGETSSNPGPDWLHFT